ncbi:hypothetical protein Zmor_024081 [Zophobas morio]|uniref:Reverse transcriptase domain-containing protein n=1 Tax=Zophobas morio TaxID=2755281 RepID=A0AA38I163_9CUCU|nr:hypothetical protein Zmor_024081 [Zophobas morio]
MKKPWIQQYFLKRARTKKQLWLKYKSTGSQAEFDRHRSYSNQLKHYLRSAKHRYELRLSKSGPKTVYKYVRTKILAKVSTPIICDTDNVFARNEEGTANIRNLPACTTPQIKPSLSNVDFSDEIVFSEFTKLPEKSSPGSDGITSLVLKRCATTISGPLAFIMTSAFQTSVLSPILLQAQVTPLLKRAIKRNQRTIYLSSICCKIMERVICHHLRQFLIDNYIISSNQYGFLPGRSTVTCLLRCLNDWSLSLERNEPTDVIYLEFEKAFDCLPHHRLLPKLENSGVQGLLLKCIETFLSDRYFNVRVGSSFSTKRNVLSAVPQGLVLGPLLFLVYVSDLLSLLKSSHFFYADDGKLYGNPLTLSQIIQDDFSISYS